MAINNVLYKCGISWSNSSSNGSQLQAVTGQCADSGDEMSGLKVTILPTSMICRKCYKKDRSGVYIWHKQSKKTGVAKMKAATTTDTWYLKSDTLMIEKDELKGTEWIRAIAKL